MARPTERLLETGPVTLNYALAGDDGPVMVLLHGLAARWQVFGPVLPALSSDWRVLALDLRGHGRSGRSPGRYRVPHFGEDVIRLLDAHGVEDAVVWGHSLGGWVGLWLAATTPERVRALIVGDSAVYPEHVDPDLAVSYLANLPLALRSLAKSLQQLDDEVMADFRAGRLTEGYDPDELLPRVRCGVLLLQADPRRDGLMSDKDVERVRAALPATRHVRCDGIGHGLHVENAGAVLDAVLAFLEGE